MGLDTSGVLKYNDILSQGVQYDFYTYAYGDTLFLVKYKEVSFCTVKIPVADFGEERSSFLYIGKQCGIDLYRMGIRTESRQMIDEDLTNLVEIEMELFQTHLEIGKEHDVLTRKMRYSPSSGIVGFSSEGASDFLYWPF